MSNSALTLAQVRAAMEPFPLTAAQKDKAAGDILNHFAISPMGNLGSPEFLDFIGKATRLVDHFRDVTKTDKDGKIVPVLTLENFAQAALKQPRLFFQSPDTIEKNIRGLVGKFAAEGLTVAGYLPAALRQPPLFWQLPDTIEKNIRGLVGKFAAEGLTVANYLPAALKQPSLFYQSPTTIARHINGFFGLQDIGLLELRNPAPPEMKGPHAAVLNMLLKIPVLLVYSDQYITLRSILAAVNDKKLNTTLFRANKEKIKTMFIDYLDALGSLPDKPEEMPEGNEPASVKHRAQLLLGGLAKAGFLDKDYPGLSEKILAKMPSVRGH